MFDYSKLLKTNTFYIEFDNYQYLDSYLVEDLIKYWFRQWFRKNSLITTNWINLNAFSVKDLIEISVDLDNCVSKNYATKDFINATKLTITLGDKRRSLRRVLEEGVNTNTCKLKGIETTFNVLSEYSTKTKLDIPDPYLVNDFNVNNTNELTELVTELIDKEDKKLTNLANELDTNTKYVLMRQQIDKVEKLQQILKLASEL